MRRGIRVATAAAAAVTTLLMLLVAGAGAGTGTGITVVYDDFSGAGGYTLADYGQKWSNIYGLGDMGTTCADGVTPAHGNTRSFGSGAFAIAEAPFTCAADYSVFDHLKYIAVSSQSFAVPNRGSLQFDSDIAAQTPGTVPGKTIHGSYGPPYSYPNGAPYTATVLEGQQAGAVMNMINFATGQLFDWFISGNTAFALIERLPSAVTGSVSPAQRSGLRIDSVAPSSSGIRASLR
jgi:hypothetical protein